MAEPTEPRVMRPGALQRGEGFFRLADRFHSAVDDAVGPAQLTARRLLFESAAREPSSFAPMGKPQSPSRRVKAEVAIDLELTAAATEDRRPRHLPLAAAPPARAVRRGETGALDVRHVRFRDRGLRGRGLVVFRRNKALMRDGAQAQALVLEAKQFGHTAVGEGPGMGIFFELKLRVQFDDGTTEEITRRVRLASLGGTSGATGGTVNVGDLLPVRYDPEDRSKIEIDSAAVKQGKEAAREAARERSKRLAIQRGEERLAAASSPGALPLAEIKAMGIAARTPVAGETGVESMLRASIAIAARKGDGAEVTRLTAKLAQQRGTSPASQGEPSDPIDRLQKLADLHDRGVLTDAEFAAEKTKLLRES